MIKAPSELLTELYIIYYKKHLIKTENSSVSSLKGKIIYISGTL